MSRYIPPWGVIEFVAALGILDAAIVGGRHGIALLVAVWIGGYACWLAGYQPWEARNGRGSTDAE